jgi:hypothetical protein
MLNKNKTQNTESGFAHPLFLLIFVAVLAIVGFTGYRVVKGSGKSKNSGTTQNTQSSIAGLPQVEGVSDCGSGKQLFTTTLMPADKISTVIPLGNFAPPGHINPTAHMYYNYTNAATSKTTMYSPADMVVTRIALFDNGSATTPFDSYRIDFALCNQVRGYFIHVITVNDKLKAAFTKPYDQTQTSDVGAANPDHTYSKSVNIKLKAGEVLGTGGGAAYLPGGVDVGLSDYRNPVPTLANPARWTLDSHYVCSLDYFPASISTALYAKIGDYNGLRNPGDPKCGEVYQDKPGTAQGVWFEKGVAGPTALGPVEAVLTLGSNNFNHSQQVFSMGNDLQKLGLTTGAVYGFTPTASGQRDRNFAQITDSQVYCYQTTNLNDSAAPKQAILVQLLDKTTLRIAKLGTACGNGPWQMSASYIDYVR